MKSDIPGMRRVGFTIKRIITCSITCSMVAVLTATFVVSTADQLAAQRQEPLIANDPARRNTSTKSSVLEQKGLNAEVTLSFRNVRLADALQSIAKQAGFRIGFSDEVSQSTIRITIENERMSAQQAILTVLAGTGLEYRVSSTGQVYVTPVAQVKTTQDYGVITGQILDSATGKGVAKASVTIPGSKTAVVTDDLGKFLLQNVPVGEVTISVKALGYLSVKQRVEVDNAKPVVLRLFLRAAVTQLSGIVTTVTGVQRKVEVGNDITSIQVDEVIRKNPVSNVSELLATRVPGLYAAQTSGQPGAPTRLRIRGVSSINASNEPIIVIDGVRVRSEGAQRDNNAVEQPGGVGFNFSPLDQIDINSIETVEVLKGPSAVALYGSDAANGVIVITSKRGKAGPARWMAATRLGVNYIPGRWPDNYYTWGTNKMFGGISRECFHDMWASAQGCQPDSMAVYQVLNDRNTTVLGRGSDQEYSIGVNGGGREVTYALTASAQRTLGLMKMSHADLQTLTDANLVVPFWQRRPQSADQIGGSALIRMEPGRATAVEFMSSISAGNARSTPLSTAMERAANMLPPHITMAGPDQKNSVIQAIRDFRERQTTSETGYRNALSVQSQAIAGINALVSLGLDRRTINRREFLGHGQLYRDGYTGPLDSGRLRQEYTSASTTDLNSNISMRPFGHRMLKLIPSVGINFIRNFESSLSTFASQLQPGATGLSGALYATTRDNVSTRNTFGAYTEVRINVADRFWLPLSFRSDAGNALGGNVISGFPKLSFSYLLSEQPTFREIPVLGTLSLFRIRAAYGSAGKQPDVAARYRTYQQLATGINEFKLNSLGNTQLRPERSQELEFGFDADVVDRSDERLTVSMTWSTKKTRDLLIQELLPLSIGMGNYWTNLGDARNTTFELSLEGLLQRQWFGWQPSINLSALRNRLLTVGKLNAAQGAGRYVRLNSYAAVQDLHVVGYPLYGRWAKDLVGYADRNGDGIIEQDEVAYSDSAVFLGAPYPKFTANTQQQLTLLSHITITGVLSYEHGLTQVNKGGMYPRVNADPTLSLREQAYGMYSARTHVQQISSLRWASAQVSYIVPHHLTKTILGSRSASLAVYGTNLGLWTTYRGKDPNVGAIGEQMFDNAQLPTPRSWGLSLRIN